MRQPDDRRRLAARARGVAALALRCRAIQVKAFFIRPAVHERVGHRLQQRPLDEPPVPSDHTRYPAHCGSTPFNKRMYRCSYAETIVATLKSPVIRARAAWPIRSRNCGREYSS